MTEKCFGCEKKKWRPKGYLKPFCSTKCKLAFEQSPARIKRLKWCEKRLERIERKKRASITTNETQSFENNPEINAKLNKEVE